MSRKRSRRYLGMTAIQLVVLGCLGFTACGTLSGGLWFIASSSAGLFPLQPGQVTLTPPPSETPVPSATPTQTATVTPVPYEALIPQGWNQYRSDAVEIWLPGEFDPVDIEQERSNAAEFYRDLGYDDIARQIEQIPADYSFWFKVSQTGPTLFATNITVEQVRISDDSLDAFLDRVEYEDLPVEYRVVDRKDFELEGIEAKRSIIEGNFNSLYVGVAQYAILQGRSVWLITCTSHFNDFYNWLPVFDQIARTFRLNN